MKYSTIEQVKKECLALNIENWREVIKAMENGESDFTVNDYRFIDSLDIDEIQVNELKEDESLLGCFATCALSEATGIDIEVFDAMREAEAFEAIGKLIISTNKVKALQEIYSSTDGYGHHFAHYDHEEHEITDGYLAFRID